MHNEGTMPTGEPTLRQSAEEVIREKGRSANLSEADVRALCHELEVHQVELEMQNEELHRVQGVLAASEERYRDLYEFAPIGYLTLDSSGVILEANLAAAALLGTQRVHLANNSFRNYLANGSIPEFRDFCRRVMDSDLKQTAELKLRGSGSSGCDSAFILAEGRAIRDGINHGFRMAAIDISRQKQAERALISARDEQELRVAERTADLQKANERLEKINDKLVLEIKERKRAEEELTVARDAAEAALKAKAEFLANMSHEIRTPMNAVIGLTGLMLEDQLTPDQRENLDIIRTNGDALLTIINDILDFSKMESDKIMLEECRFNLQGCVEESLDLVAFQASEKGLNIAYIIDKSTPNTIIGDPTRLRQMLGNLLSNAVKFTDEGEIILSVSSEQIDGTNELHFSIQDTGIGISPSRMKLLFQPFNQMEPLTTRLYGGTGLGLAISKKLVEMMGGRIWAESEEGVGSKFHFTIRASSGDFEPQLNAASPLSPQMISKCVLIVVDNKTNRRILSRQVYDWGMIPVIAASGREALRFIRQGDDFDVAILDTDLRDMSGQELEEKIRKYNSALPLILLVFLGERIPPGHACLTKPIKPSQLHNALMDILAGQPARGSEKSSGINADRPLRNRPLKILLAEDNVSSQKVTLQMLRKLGYKADTVANGIEALHALERQHYNVVLMDIQMPEMDGLEAARVIRRRWQNERIKIIAITAYVLTGDREKCIEAGMDDYLSKPVTLDDLKSVLDKFSHPSD